MKKYKNLARLAIMQNLITLLTSEPHRAWRSLYADCLCDLLLR